MSKIITIMKKELWGYFSNPTALVFLGSYLFISLFSFFWVEKFFSRDIADLRPLFEWMPLLLIFLVSTLTMKMWSEEKRVGTIEFLMTLPIKVFDLVMGKFLACLFLTSIALLLTLGLAFTVANLGPLDWGPAIGAYLASLLLAGSYIAIGLYISSKTDSQITCLISTVIVGAIFYLIGSDVIVSLFNNNTGQLFRSLGTGARFESISRGVLDFRDIYYYLSVIAVFLTLNVLSLEKLKWSREKKKSSHTHLNWVSGLVIANFIVANVWLYGMKSLRVDMTKDKIYSISQASKDIISQLNEPVSIRGYFSERTHPLLAPLVPKVVDMLKEYQIAGEESFC